LNATFRPFPASVLVVVPLLLTAACGETDRTEDGAATTEDSQAPDDTTTEVPTAGSDNEPLPTLVPTVTAPSAQGGSGSIPSAAPTPSVGVAGSGGMAGGSAGMGGASNTACVQSIPERPTILSPVANAVNQSAAELTFAASPLADADGHLLVSAEFELRLADAAADTAPVWTGTATGTEMQLSLGQFSLAGNPSLAFDQRYALTVRYHDSGECNTVSPWSLPTFFTTTDGSDELFDPSIVRSIELTIPTDNGPPSSWESINSEAAADDCVAIRRNYYEGSVTFEGVSYPGVGIHIKGGCGSSRDLDGKASFKVNLEWDADPTDAVCPEKRRIYGKKTLSLNNGVQDDTAMHEHLTFDFYRAAGVPAPRTAAIQVSVNGVYFGLYQLIETVDRSLLRRWFDTSGGDGMMYEGAYFCDFINGDDAALEDGYCWDREFELDSCDGTPEPGDDLQTFEADGVTPQDPWQFARNLQTSLVELSPSASYFPAIGGLVDWDAFLTYWATSTIVFDWDNYAHNQNNFRFYHDTQSGLWHFLPWGVDQTWVVREARGGGGGGGGGLTVNPLSARGDIARLCLEASGVLETQTCTDTYIAKLSQLVQTFESTDWITAIDTWQARLDPFIRMEDDRKSYTYEEWLEALEELRAFAADRPTLLREEVAEAGFTL
jgi:spore coat protein CotH